MKQLGVMALTVLLAACGSTPPEVRPALVQQQELDVRLALAAEAGGRWETAAAQWADVLSLAQATDNWSQQARARLGLASALLRLQQAKLAFDVLQPMQQATDGLFTPEVRAQAALLQARAALLVAPEQLPALLKQAQQQCSDAACRWRAALLNLQAREAFLRADWAQGLSLATQAYEVAGSEVERAHALRNQALARLERGELADARQLIGQALLIDQALAEPQWLLDDYRLLARIERLAPSGRGKEVEQRVRSLCEGVRLPACAALE